MIYFQARESAWLPDPWSHTVISLISEKKNSDNYHNCKQYRLFSTSCQFWGSLDYKTSDCPQVTENSYLPVIQAAKPQK